MTLLHAEVERFFDDFNRAWLERRFTDARALLDPDVVIAPPGAASRVRGADAFLQSLEGFMAAAQVHAFHTESVEVEHWGEQTFAAWLRYEIEYTESDRRSRERGLELWILRCEAGAFHALLREVHPPVAV